MSNRVERGEVFQDGEIVLLTSFFSLFYSFRQTLLLLLS